jgi:long-chain acyl-CoA synthetase
VALENRRQTADAPIKPTDCLTGPSLDLEALEARGLAVPPFALGALLTNAARAWPAAIWIKSRDASLRYDEAADLAARIGASLTRDGLRPGDRVAVMMPNHPAFVAAIWGSWHAGACCAALHPAYGEPTLACQLDDLEPRFLITLDRPDLLARATRLAVARDVRLVVLPASGLIEASGWLGAARTEPHATDVDAVALLQYTGGTTGGVKAAMLSHRAISTNLAQLVGALPDLRVREERMLAVAPFAHVTGFSALLCAGTYLGATIIVEDRFDQDETARLCLQERITYTTCVPTVIEAFNRSPIAQAGDWQALKYVVAGGAPLPGATRTRFEAMTGCQLCQGYGLSETSPAVVIGYGVAGAPADSVGPPLAGTTIAISAPDDPGRFLARGEEGEIRIAGPQVMQGFWRQPVETAAALDGGMLRTGDIGRIDAHGRVQVSSRLKDLIIASGYNIYPSRIEDALFGHPAVADVAVIGVPDAYRGETVKAVIVPKHGCELTLAEIQAWLAPLLSPMEMPKLIELRESLPKTPAGKTLKTALR